LNKPLPERVTGIDLMQRLVSLAHAKDYKIYLLGAKEEVVSKMVRTYSNTYSATLVAGSRNGYFKEDEEEEIAMEINMSRANMLFVAMSSPKKEIFLDKYRDLLKNVNLIMGVGGSFDVITGKTKRAPLWMQSSGLEWLYRFLQEPGRMWKRYLIGNTKFVLLVLSELIRRKPFK
jgi:N-acetylglucosaminyldiphosphoundecaprenol N-acetyl-beta-D-mannosaminyltransferase